MSDPVPSPSETPEASEPIAPAPPAPRLSWVSRISLFLGLAAGPAYVAWIAGVEGSRIFVVLGLILMVAAFAGLSHWLMGLTRR